MSKQPGWLCECGMVVPWGVGHGHAPALTVGTSFRHDTESGDFRVTRGPGTHNSAAPAEWVLTPESEAQLATLVGYIRAYVSEKDAELNRPSLADVIGKSERAAVAPALSMNRVVRALLSVGMNDPHWSWRCHHPDKGEQPCDLTDEAEAFIAALTEDVP